MLMMINVLMKTCMLTAYDEDKYNEDEDDDDDNDIDDITSILIHVTLVVIYVRAFGYQTHRQGKLANYIKIRDLITNIMCEQAHVTITSLLGLVPVYLGI